jgi:hypothetical protein
MMRPKWIYCTWCGEAAVNTDQLYTCESCGGKSIWTSHGTIPYIEEIPISNDSVLLMPGYLMPPKETDEATYQLRGVTGRLGIDCLRRGKKETNQEDPPQFC